MPFPDELARGLAVVAYDHSWPGDFAVLARRIGDALGPAAVRVSHVGSTSVPGLAAKDCIDVLAEVRALDEQLIAGCLSAAGFRLRPEPWNRAEPTPGGPCPKLVFAPPEGERASNIHVAQAGSEAARRKLLFRDFLRAHDTARDAWGHFKQHLAAMATDIFQYGQAKAGPTEIAMIAAESWARQTQWAPGTGSSMPDPAYSETLPIRILTHLQCVRLRPGMYIGPTDERGLHHLADSVIDNAANEAGAGFADRIAVTLTADGGVRVSDNGRGLPVDENPFEHHPAPDRLLTGFTPDTSLPVINALSARLDVEVCRDGHVWRQSYAAGEATGPLRKGEETAATGTAVTFWPDPGIFETTVWSAPALAARLQEMASRHQEVAITLTDERPGSTPHQLSS